MTNFQRKFNVLVVILRIVKSGIMVFVETLAGSSLCLLSMFHLKALDKTVHEVLNSLYLIPLGSISHYNRNCSYIVINRNSAYFFSSCFPFFQNLSLLIS